MTLAALHMIGHVMGPPEPQDADERRLVELMETYERDFGIGLERTTEDFVLGFSLSMSVFTLFAGLTGIAVARHGGDAAIRAVLVLDAGMCGVMLVVSLVYFFAAPASCFLLALLAFVLGLARGGPRARSA